MAFEEKRGAVAGEGDAGTTQAGEVDDQLPARFKAYSAPLASEWLPRLLDWPGGQGSSPAVTVTLPDHNVLLLGTNWVGIHILVKAFVSSHTPLTKLLSYQCRVLKEL